MARTTSFTASAVARMIAWGEVAARGVKRPEAVEAGAAVDSLLHDLLAHGIRVSFAEEQPGAARGVGSPPATPGAQL